MTLGYISKFRKKEKAHPKDSGSERFKILSNRYRNRRKRFSLRFNLIAGVYNLELVP